MPVILSPDQSPSLRTLIDDIAQTKSLVTGVLPGSQHSEQTLVQGIGPLTTASPRELSFVVSAKFKDELGQTSACAVIVPKALSSNEHGDDRPTYAQVICEQPYLLYALFAHWFDTRRQPKRVPGIHPSAVVDETAQVSASAIIGPNVVIGARTTVGDHVNVSPGCVVGSDCSIGTNTMLYPHVTLYDHVHIGQRGIIHSGVVLGADGFGFAPNPAQEKGAWGKIAQLGGVSIGNDVEIGANTTIDRGALENTVIGNGVKLDNQIMIGHNCKIGDHTAMAACVGVAGSTTIGARCIIGGAAMFSGHITIVDDVQVSGGTAITSNIDTAGRLTGVLPAAPHAQWQRNAAVMGQLGDMRKRLRQLERKLPETS